MKHFSSVKIKKSLLFVDEILSFVVMTASIDFEFMI